MHKSPQTPGLLVPSAVLIEQLHARSQMRPGKGRGGVPALV